MKLISILSLVGLSACKNVSVENNDADLLNRKDKRDVNIGKLLGDDALQLDTVGKTKLSDQNIITVNVYLWRASLICTAFMPLQSVDPIGGVIITDWYTKQDSPLERIKLNIRILGRELKVQALSVSVFRQKNQNGIWVDQMVNAEMAQKIENAILMRAWEMKAATGL